MAISYVNVGARTNSSGATSATPALPASRVNGNLLIAICGTKNNASHSTATSGWQKLSQRDSGTGWTLSIFYRTVDGTEAAPVITWSGSVANFAIQAQYSGADRIIGNFLGNNGTTSPHTNAGITAIRKNSQPIYIGGAAANTAYGTNTGWSENSDAGSATGATRHVFGRRNATINNGDASGSISLTGAAAAWVLYQIELLEPLTLSGGVTIPTQTVSGTAEFLAASSSFEITGAVTTPMQVSSGTIVNGDLLLDVYPAYAAYSLRKLRTAYTGSAIRVRRSSDDAEQDIGFVSGELDTTSLLSFVGSGDGFVKTWYDQQGSNNFTQTTNSAQPKIVISGGVYFVNGKPSITFGNQLDTLSLISPNDFLSGQATPILFNAVWKATDWSGSNSALFAPDDTNSIGLEVLQVGVLDYLSYLRINNSFKNDGGAAYQLWNDATQSLTTINLGTTTLSAYKNNEAVTLSNTSSVTSLDAVGNYAIGKYDIDNYSYLDVQEIIIALTDETDNIEDVNVEILDYYNIGEDTSNISGAVTTPMQTTSGTAEFINIPTYEISGAVTIPIQTTSGTAEFVKPIYSISGGVTTPIQVAEGTATFTKPIFEISGATTTPMQTVSGEGTFTKPIYSINGGTTTPIQTVEGSATFSAPIYEITGAVTTPIQLTSGTSTFEKPIYELSGAVNTPMQTVEGSISFGVQVFEITGSVTIPTQTINGTATFLNVSNYKVWNGAAWVSVTPKHYNGTNWNNIL
jgi:hypothetical protein